MCGVSEKLRWAILVQFLDFATSALYPGCGAHRGILAFPGPCEIRGDSIHGPALSEFSFLWVSHQACFLLLQTGLGRWACRRVLGLAANPPGILIPRIPPSPESLLVIPFVLCGRRGADRTTHALQKTQALDRWSPRATEAQWYSIDQIWHIYCHIVRLEVLYGTLGLY